MNKLFIISGSSGVGKGTIIKRFLEKNQDIALLADLMGHESIETTRIYLRRTSEEQQKIVDEIVNW